MLVAGAARRRQWLDYTEMRPVSEVSGVYSPNPCIYVPTVPYLTDYGLAISPKTNSRHFREFDILPSGERSSQRGEIKLRASGVVPLFQVQHLNSKFDFAASAERQFCAETCPVRLSNSLFRVAVNFNFNTNKFPFGRSRIARAYLTRQTSNQLKRLVSIPAEFNSNFKISTLTPKQPTWWKVASQTEVATYVLGGWDIGICADLFFQGILYTQFIRYMKICKRDSPWLKLFVAGLAFLTTLKSIQAISMLWLQNVIKFEDLASASVLWRTHWLFHLTVIGSALVAFYVQLPFFCVRLWVMSRNIYIVFVVSLLFVMALAAASAATFYIFRRDFDRGLDWLAVHLGTAFLGDLILTVGIVVFLIRHSRVVIPHGETAHMVTGLLRLTIQSAAPAAMVALVNFIAATRINVTNERIRVELMLCEISNMVLPQLYAMSAMWTLNSREDIRAEAEGASELDTFSLVPAPPPADAEWSANDSIHETSPGPSLDILDEKSPPERFPI
ncbi:hypothetical protein R3P38DRAFT_3277957 [Favolaschia claudopus]|uniref:DUF6534 domain-containing protein n=1 Tax=Favolaschia claudopus TaxID=2862362 RepID=A0AAW0AJ82_9AGAR